MVLLWTNLHFIGVNLHFFGVNLRLFDENLHFLGTNLASELKAFVPEKSYLEQI